MENSESNMNGIEADAKYTYITIEKNRRKF